MYFINQVELRIEEEELIRPGDAVVVAVSGGPDSVALLHVLFVLSGKYGWKLIVAHVNHKFRGIESDAEALYVKELAAKWGLPCEIGEIDVPAYIEETSLNAQSAARLKRYEFLHKVADQYKASRIALAHHADDQAETLLMRFLRGTGPSGLTGMPERRLEKKVELIRPLLRIYKTVVVQYCREQGLHYCMDSSNELRKYVRNQIRLDVMPYLKTYNDRLPEALNRLAEMMRAEDDYMEAEADKVFAAIVISETASCRFAKSEFARLHVALQRRLIKLILSYLALKMERFDFERMELIRSAILRTDTANLQLDIGESFCLVKEYDEIRFQPSCKDASPYCYEVEMRSGDLILPEAGYILRIAVYDRETAGHLAVNRTGSEREAWFDLDLLEGPLYARSRQAGDRIQPIGLNGSKKVKDMFIDAKVPPSFRDAIPLLVDARGRVLWIPEVRRSQYALVHARTLQLLHVQLL